MISISKSTYTLPLESYLKLLAVTIGIIGECYTGFNDEWVFTAIHNGQHMTMFAFFAFNAIFELIYYYHGARQGSPSVLPPKLDYMTAIAAFAVEGILFLWHLDGRPKMDIQVKVIAIFMNRSRHDSPNLLGFFESKSIQNVLLKIFIYNVILGAHFSSLCDCDVCLQHLR